MSIIQRVKWQIGYLLDNSEFRRTPHHVVSRLVAWRLMTLRAREIVVDLPLYGARFSLPPVWNGVQKLMYVFRNSIGPEPDLLFASEQLESGGVVVDVGANLGEWTVTLARVVGPSGRVFAFEPTSSTADHLAKTLRLNELEWVQLERTALADQEGAGHISHDSRTHTRNYLSATGVGTEVVRIATIDSYVDRVDISRLDLIKIDVEGAEGLVVRGGLRAIERFRPKILFEINPEAASRLNQQPDDAWSQLGSIGYQFFRVRDELTLQPCEQIPNEDCNIVGIPGPCVVGEE